MIKAPPGLLAKYKYKSESHIGCRKARVEHVGDTEVPCEAGEYISGHNNVIAWDEDGEPLVIGERGRLQSALRHSNFVGVEQSERAIVQLIPATDWVIWRVEPSGEVWGERLVAWALCADGAVRPLETDSHGCVDTPGETEQIFVRHASDGRPTDEWIAERVAAYEAARKKRDERDEERKSSAVVAVVTEQGA